MYAGIVLPMEDQRRRAVFLDVPDRTAVAKILPVVPQVLEVMDVKHLLGNVGRTDLGNVIADLIDACSRPVKQPVIDRSRSMVADLCYKFPIYPNT